MSYDDDSVSYGSPRIDYNKSKNVPPSLNRMGTLYKGFNKVVEKTDLYYQVLIHTVSHSDVVMSLLCKDNESLMVGRPSFSYYMDVCEKIYEYIEQKKDIKPYRLKRHRRLDPNETSVPIGYDFVNPIKFDNWDAFRLREVSFSQKGDNPNIVGVFFPLLGLILPRWISICDEKYKNGVKILYLLSGSGTPWDPKESAVGNSTEFSALLLAAFIQRFYPSIKVVLVHSGPAIFHYGPNVRFVNEKLRPLIYSLRQQLARIFYEKWRERMHVTLSISRGAPARIAAVSASMREFRPDTLHMWQSKTFWHTYPDINTLYEDDLDFNSFDQVEATPPIQLNNIADDEQRNLILEMIQHKRAFESVRDSSSYNELERFWLRKSKQPVLCVLMVKKKKGRALYYRGINAEVSLPTGSLCSERNAIGQALATDMSLRRQEIKMIAVMTLNLDEKSNVDKNPIYPCGACSEWLKKIAEVNPDFKVISFTDSSCDSAYVHSVDQLS